MCGWRRACRAGVRVSGGHLCEAEAPTEAKAENLLPPQKGLRKSRGGTKAPPYGVAIRLCEIWREPKRLPYSVGFWFVRVLG